MTSTEQKLLIIIVSDADADRLIRIMVEHGLPATKISSTGGFLRKGNATILPGVDAPEVPAALALIGANAAPARKPYSPPPAPSRKSV